MATVNRIGKETINDRLIVEVTNTDPSTVNVVLNIRNRDVNPYPLGGTTIDQVTRMQFKNDPEIGTSDTFRFEVNKAVRSLTEILFETPSATYERFPELLTYDFLANTNMIISYPYAGAVVIELDSDGNQVGSAIELTGSDRINVYPLNLLRNEILNDFITDNNGNTSRRFMTNAPLIQNIKREDFVWIWIYRTSLSSQEIVFQELDINNNVINEVVNVVNSPQSESGYAVHPTGFQYQMPSDPTIVAFQAFVRDRTGGTVRSETRRWNVKEYCDEVKLWWMNRFSSMELTYFDGNRAKRLNNKRRTVQNVEPVNATFEEGGTHIFNNEFGRTWRCSVKRGNPDYIAYVVEILYSKRMAIEENGELVEVVCTNSNINEYEKDESIQFLTFDFEESKRTEIW